jgi:hypothetical protein
LLIDRGAIAATRMQKGNAAAKFLRLQLLAGVDSPKVLVSRAQTRYAMSARIVDRLVELRQFVNEGMELVKLPTFDTQDWRTLLQCGAFLRAAEDLTVALQSREYLIGDHIGALYNYLQMLRQPDTVRVHSADFVPSAVQLNVASKRGVRLSKRRRSTSGTTNGARSSARLASPRTTPRHSSRPW